MFKNIYKETIPEVFNKLKTSKSGLKKEDVKERQETYGLNVLPEKKDQSIFKMIFEQVNNPLIYILFFTALFSLSIGHHIDSIIILFVVVLNLCIGIYHELKAKKIIKSLEEFSAPTCMVRRDGKIHEIETKNLVPGDIVLLTEGDKVPADLRVTYALNVTTIEAPLTGESIPVEKNNIALKDETQLAERKNMMYMGTIFAAGEAEAVVVHTGESTELGKIATTLSGIEEEKTLFLKRTSTLTRTLAIIATAGAILTFLIGIVKGIELNLIILFTVASFISAIPEGLPAVLTVVLSVAAYRLAKKKSVVRSLASIETLSTITTIITDKTGTLTQNSMTITKLFLGDKREIEITGKTWEPMGDFLFKNDPIFPREDKYLKFILPLLAIVNKAEVNKGDDGHYEIFGDPTEASRVVLAEKANYVKDELLKKNYSIIQDVPYSQDTKYRGMILKDNEREKTFAVLVGGAENIMNICNYTMLSKKKVRKIDEHKDAYSRKINKWASEAMRLQAIAFQEVDEKTKKLKDIDYKKFVFLGAFGINDPIRDNVPHAIQKAQSADIRIIMATGDNKETAIAIGKEIGIKHQNKDYPYAMEELELEKLNEKELKDAIKNVSVFARLTPDTKFRIAETLQNDGEILAMTGDGVNDSLALKKANIGISMGIIGTDVARESSDMILMDDNFATIVDAIEEGLTVFRNLRQTSTYLLSTNLAEDAFIILALIIGTPLPLLPIHILWLNLLTDGLLDVSLATEDTHEDVWEEGMKKKEEQIIDKKQFVTLAISISLLCIIGLTTFLHFLPEGLDSNVLEHPGLDKARTMTFAMLTCSQIFFIFSLRSPTISIFKLGFFTNKYLFISIFIVIVLTGLLIEVPFLADIFRFTPLKLNEILAILAISTTPLWVMEFYKYLKRNGYLPK